MTTPNCETDPVPRSVGEQDGERAGPAGNGDAGEGEGEGEEERERSTWITEDDDVWGNDDDAAPPVIG